MNRVNSFNSKHPVCRALAAAGYVPPNCMRMDIALKAGDIPRITAEALVSDELTAWADELRRARPEIVVRFETPAPPAGIVAAVVDLLNADGHGWSVRPCTTCETVTRLLGVPFGCVRKRLDQRGA